MRARALNLQIDVLLVGQGRPAPALERSGAHAGLHDLKDTLHGLDD
jgi:hypothetical protein